jgi:hypothetical protein
VGKHESCKLEPVFLALVDLLNAIQAQLLDGIQAQLLLYLIADPE